jgi:signal transduction histidine kinase
VRRELQPVPRVVVDPEQIQKVVTNLFLNAAEALTGEGQIRIETSAQNGWAQLAISDNGCGMTPEFIRRDLFQPFRTTKKKGIGIGMFHTKAIVDAHRGRIDVESEVGKGTTFRVFLPVAGGAL